MSDRDLVMRWIRAWVSLRKLAMEDVGGWPLVHVRGPSRDREILCVDPGREAFDALAAHLAHDHRAMITVFGRDLGLYRAPPPVAGLRIDRDDESFMTKTLAGMPVPAEELPPTGVTGRWVVDGPRATYRLEDAGRVAAEGTAGVLGADAVFDAVETTASHRRRGLGRHVMTMLTTWAIDRGATTGLLAASGEGASLYSALGWESRLAMWSLMGELEE